MPQDYPPIHFPFCYHMYSIGSVQRNLSDWIATIMWCLADKTRGVSAKDGKLLMVQLYPHRKAPRLVWALLKRLFDNPRPWYTAIPDSVCKWLFGASEEDASMWNQVDGGNFRACLYGSIEPAATAKTDWAGVGYVILDMGNGMKKMVGNTRDGQSHTLYQWKE